MKKKFIRKQLGKQTCNGASEAHRNANDLVTCLPGCKECTNPLSGVYSQEEGGCQSDQSQRQVWPSVSCWQVKSFGC